MTNPGDVQIPHTQEKPWGHELWWAYTDRYVGKILHVNAGQRLSLQYHHEKDESCYVLNGKILLTQGPSDDKLTVREIGVGEVWRNEPSVIHTIEAIEDADVLEVSTPEVDDVVRLKDEYGREGTTAL
jgi:mannose-6-phosphate isomerase